MKKNDLKNKALKAYENYVAADKEWEEALKEYERFLEKTAPTVIEKLIPYAHTITNLRGGCKAPGWKPRILISRLQTDKGWTLWELTTNDTWIKTDLKNQPRNGYAINQEVRSSKGPMSATAFRTAVKKLQKTLDCKVEFCEEDLSKEHSKYTGLRLLNGTIKVSEGMRVQGDCVVPIPEEDEEEHYDTFWSR